MTAAASAREHLAVLAAQPRPAGGDEEKKAREYCARVLKAAGFRVREEPFTYSSFPGTWATPLVGVISLIALEIAAWLGRRGSGGAALALLIVVALILVAGVRWLIRTGVMGAGIMRRRGLNLVANRGADVSLWLVAHLDSKSQPVPIAARALGVIGTVGTWIAALALAAGDVVGWHSAGAWLLLALMALIAGIPVALTTVGARSPGALDNASGVATVLRIAQQAPESQPIGVLLTSAEELGLAGARAWARAHPRGRAVNFDGVDDRGSIRITPSGTGSAALIQPLLAAAKAEGVRARAGRLIPGVLVDGVALAEAGWHVVTISKGTWRTVARIHTPRDRMERLDGSGVTVAASLVTRALGDML
ncbi:MAG: M28 family metallopeptidase [Gemmatimonadota bacterium]|nr:M28 family metallopeptidase [Gemmatimonadota bacterium]